MAVLHFHKAADPSAHENFVRWCAQNPLGLFVNYGPREAMLHRVGCPHTANWRREEWGDLEHNRKLCSTDEQELLDHHLRESGEHPTKCSDCL